MLAIFDRAEPRDFTDLDAVTRVFSVSDLVELAARKDTGSTGPGWSRRWRRFDGTPQPTFASA